MISSKSSLTRWAVLAALLLLCTARTARYGFCDDAIQEKHKEVNERKKKKKKKTHGTGWVCECEKGNQEG